MDPGRAPSAATQLITPSRRRRGSSVAVGDRIDDARRDLAAATRLAPHDATLARERETIEAELEDLRACAAPLDAAAAREVGDERYRAGDIAGAEAAYAAVIDMPPHACPPRTARRRSRTAPRVVSRDRITAPRDDCDDGFDALLRDAGADAARARDAARRSTSQTPLPDASWALLGKLLHRRGAAAAHLRAYDDAAEDYDAAAARARRRGPAADALRRDAETVRARARASEEENATMSVSSPRSVEARDAKMESSGGSVGFRGTRATLSRRGGRRRVAGTRTRARFEPVTAWWCTPSVPSGPNRAVGSSGTRGRTRTGRRSRTSRAPGSHPRMGRRDGRMSRGRASRASRSRGGSVRRGGKRGVGDSSGDGRDV